MDLLSFSYMALRRSKILFVLVVVIITLTLVINYFWNYNVRSTHHHDYKSLDSLTHYHTNQAAIQLKKLDLAQDIINYESNPGELEFKQYDAKYQSQAGSVSGTRATQGNQQSPHNAVYIEESVSPTSEATISPLSNSFKEDSHGYSESELSGTARISSSHKNIIKNFANNLWLCKGVPGMTVGIVKDEDHWILPLGFRDLNNKSPVTSDTKFFLGSVTKTFTAQLVALMIQESDGSLTWDTPVVQIMGPDFHLATAELTNEVTLRDLLSHRSGLVSGNLAVRASFPKDLKRIELLKYFNQIPANTELGKEFLYSNMGYTLAGTVIEHYWKRSYEDLIQEKLLRPLGMNHSILIHEAKDLLQHDFAKPYVPVEGGIEDCEPKVYELGPVEVTGSLGASAEDMVKWLKFTLNPRKFFKHKKHLPNLLADMWMPNIQLNPSFRARTEKKIANGWPVDDLSLGYGMGWFLNKYRGVRNFWHGGGLYSYFTLVWILPEANLGIFISMNGYEGCNDSSKSQHTKMTDIIRKSHHSALLEEYFISQNNLTVDHCQCGSGGFGIVESLAYVITDTLLQLTPWINEKNGCQYPQPWIQCGTGNDSHSNGKLMKSKEQNLHQMSGAMLDIYKGVYSNELLGKLYIYMKDPETELHFHLRLLDGILRFRKLSDNETTFGLECTGNYRFLSKPDRFDNQPAKQTFVLKFYHKNYKKVHSVHIYFSEKEKPFVFDRLLSQKQ